MASATLVLLSDDHIDLLVTAAVRWPLSSSASAACSRLEDHLLVGTACEAGRSRRAESTAAGKWLYDRGRTRLIERAGSQRYAYREVERLEPVKAARDAQACCAGSPTWEGSAARRLLAAVITAATHRLDGYCDARWRGPALAAAAGTGWASPPPGAPTCPGWAGPAHTRRGSAGWRPP